MAVLRFLKPLILGLSILLSCGVFASQADSRVTFRGEIDYQAENRCRGMVVLWPVEGQSVPTLERTNLVPPWIRELDSECHFEIKVPPGSYYLQAVVRQAPGHASGPLRIGDLVFSAGSADGQPLQVSGNAGDQITLAALATSSEFKGFSEPVETGITGRLVDEKGRPMAGLRVLAFKNAERFSGLYAVSSPSDADGQFRLHLTGKSEVYLQAREELGTGSSLPGSLIGVYGNEAATLIKVEQGQRVERVEIVVAPRNKEDIEKKK